MALPRLRPSSLSIFEIAFLFPFLCQSFLSEADTPLESPLCGLFPRLHKPLIFPLFPPSCTVPAFHVDSSSPGGLFILKCFRVFKFPDRSGPTQPPPNPTAGPFSPPVPALDLKLLGPFPPPRRDYSLGVKLQPLLLCFPTP